MSGIAAGVDAIGLVSGVLGIVDFFSSLMPEEPPDAGVLVGIKAGRGPDDDNMAGDVKAVYSWDVDNRYLGEGDGATLKNGDYQEITVGQTSAGAQAEYVGIAIDNDAVCIAWIVTKQFDKTKGGAWTGDIGYACGQDWYEQNQRAGTDKDTGEDYIPKCTWLDADHTNDIASAALKFNLQAYGENVNDTADNDLACDSTVWGEDPGPINGLSPLHSPAIHGPELTRVVLAEPSKRAPRPRPTWMQKKLITSNITSHKSSNLCNSATSWGPDFVGSDGYFCDMETKILTPLCITENVDGCMEINNSQKKVTKRSNVARREVSTEFKSYEHVDNWD